MRQIRTDPIDAQRSTAVSVGLLAFGGLAIAGVVIANELVDRQQVFSVGSGNVVGMLPGSPWTWAIVIGVSSLLMLVSVFRGMNTLASVTLYFNSFWCLIVAFGLGASVLTEDTPYSLVYPMLYILVAIFQVKNAVLAWRGRTVETVCVPARGET